MKQQAFQVRLNILRPKYKTFLVSGIVLASSQVAAIKTAQETLIKTLEESNNESTVKLLSASPLKNDFFLIAKEAVENTVKNK